MSRKDAKGRVLRKGESQRKDNSYQYRYTDIDGMRQCIYSWRLTETDRTPDGKKDSPSLREQEQEINRKLAEGISARSGNLTLNQMFDDYVVRKKHRGKNLAESTVINYTSMWKKNIRETTWEEMKLAQIRKSNIVDLFHHIAEEGQSYGTILFFKKVLSGVFNMAIDDGIISMNPTKRSMDEVEGAQAVKEALTAEQQEGLLKYAKQHDPSMYKKLVFLIETMCRVGEFAGMTWDDIDMKQYYFVFHTDAQVEGKSNFVFCSSAKNLISEHQFNGELKRLVVEYNKSAKYPIPTICPHMLRHTGCTRRAEDGMDLRVLQYLMGHSSAQITNDIYNHVQEERARKAIINAEKSRRASA